jgi:hypothetical protein
VVASTTNSGTTSSSATTKTQKKKRTAVVTPCPVYGSMHRGELVTELMSRQLLERGGLRPDSFTHDQLADEAQWTTTDLQMELVAMDEALALAKYKNLNADELVDEILSRQANQHVIHRDGEFNRTQLVRKSRDDLVNVLRDLDAKEIRIRMYVSSRVCARVCVCLSVSVRLRLRLRLRLCARACFVWHAHARTSY